MSLLNKIGAVAVGLGAVVEGIAGAALDSIGDKVGKGSISDRKGNSYTGRDYKIKGGELEDASMSGLKKAKELWERD